MSMQFQKSAEMDREVLLDVSRLIWRSWFRKLPTGIDRVCLAYVDHFRRHARAVIQRNHWRIVLGKRESERLFDMLLKGRNISRLDWAAMAVRLAPSALMAAPSSSQAIYLNVGHTGLDRPSLAEWIVANDLRAVYMIHDLIPVTHPQYCRAGECERHQRRLDTMLTSASGIIGNSQSTLTAFQRYAQARDVPVPPSVAALIAGHTAPNRPSPPWIDRPYFLVLGTIEGRKNHMLLLRIWRRLASALGSGAPLLVIAGQRGWEAESTFHVLDDLGDLEGCVAEWGNCDDVQLASLIAGAQALLMPSFVEGFGLPIIEALQLFTPVIASNLPVYREIAGDIPTYLDPRDEETWFAAIKDFMSNGIDRQRQMVAMSGYEAPSWSQHFQRVDPWLAAVGR